MGGHINKQNKCIHSFTLWQYYFNNVQFLGCGIFVLHIDVLEYLFNTLDSLISLQNATAITTEYCYCSLTFENAILSTE